MNWKEFNETILSLCITSLLITFMAFMFNFACTQMAKERYSECLKESSVTQKDLCVKILENVK